jgi:hypothetical protein
MNDAITNMTKEEGIDYIKNNNVSKSEMLHILNTLKSKGIKVIPNEVRIGDVFFHRELVHPAVVISLKKDYCYSLLLTNNDKLPETTIANSRFYSESYITKTLVINTRAYIEKNFHGIFNNNTQLLKIKKEFKLFIKNI